jgi:pimeloyl-ACP methyl ester carboxylesterase
MREVQTGYAEINGTKLYYEVAGEGQPLVLIHGGLVDNRIWDEQFQVFANYYKVVRYDVRGYGRTAIPEMPFSNVEDLAGLLDFLKLDKVYLLGMALGGGIALDFTLTYPKRVLVLATLSSSLNGFRNSSQLRQRAMELFQLANTHDYPGAIGLFIRLWVDGEHGTADSNVRNRIYQIISDYSFVHYDYSTVQSKPLRPATIERLGEINVPLLVLVGERDQADNLKIAAQLKQRVTHSRQEVLDASAQFANLEQPEKFNQLVLDFLAESQPH